ncbi:iron-sulfur cluster repair di-iron protein [Aquimarina hainanensis]|uniref:Iron-sulfur cluster repair di-iron protein n=1 Tax=Aquimarina hainanensis TaxID=1578017 RepID=A0ABW5NAN7_9FLAO|nr:iron-sulfur cluster repair di-iron protein [Aquimarina sp. TRL1]QKX04003.1 iron-sulfur cluster repair di-iron protein [Aquimarina sp. TRL1]
MIITAQKTVAEVVADNIKTAHVFKKYGIDFCCGGGITIQKACSNHNIDYDIVRNELMAIDQKNKKEFDYNNWELGFLIDHIIHVHHTYVEESIGILLAYTEKVANVHGHHYPELIKIKELFLEVANELTTHMKKEELILFPFIKKLIKADQTQTPYASPHFGTVKNPVQMMEYEHENAGTIFKTIAKLTNNYTPPEEACNTFKALYAELDDFEQDLHLHIHLENNIVHPKAVALEKKVQNCL